MAGSSFGTLFRITTWGESHGPGIGVVIDGCPAGLPLAVDDIQRMLDLRRPGQSIYTTARKEGDRAEILSGVMEGITTGTPISILVRNTDQRSRDYGNLESLYRPGHADYCYDQKYGIRDYRGGGRSSARETIGRVAAGAVAEKLLAALGVSFCTYTQSIGPVQIDPSRFQKKRILSSPLRMPDETAEQEARAFLDECIRQQDSAGGTVVCEVCGLPAGIGEPVFDKLDARLAQAVMSIGAVKAVEIGDGVLAARTPGSENNDQYLPACAVCPGGTGNSGDASGSAGIRQPDIFSDTGRPVKTTNHSGGILGGISDGSPLIIRASFKPTPSISRPQSMLGKDGACHMETIQGRHDPVVVPRAVIVVESMAAVTLADLLLCQMGARMEYLQRIYR